MPTDRPCIIPFTTERGFTCEHALRWSQNVLADVAAHRRTVLDVIEDFWRVCAEDRAPDRRAVGSNR
jgi:hypothetical protein